MTDEDTVTRHGRRRSYWVGELTRRGMTEARAELLQATPGLDLHAVAAALDAGCDPDVAWAIWNNVTGLCPP